jgi:hypothetical protein
MEKPKKQRNWKLFFERLWLVYACITASIFILFAISDMRGGYSFNTDSLWFAFWFAIIPVAISRAVQWIWASHKDTAE